VEKSVRKKYTWQCGTGKIALGRRTHIVGILNVTPDSFSDGGLFTTPESALARALEMAENGADIIDVGGESTRPGAAPVSESEEMARVLPVIEALTRHLDVPVSIDTYKSRVARQALDAGATIVNDISGLRFDKAMASTVAETGAGVIIMHIKGTPRNMQINPSYDDVMGEISGYLQESVRLALSAGISRRSIAIDPGLGFGKRLKDNFFIIKHLDLLKRLDYPILIGPSRKSFIGSTLDLPETDRLEGTIAAVTAGIIYGAHLVRVHDVKEVKRAAVITDRIVHS
jgi:dihydropteroate synthase